MPPFRFLVCQQDPAAGEEPVSFDDALGIFGDVLRAEGCTAEPAPKNDSAVRFEDNDQGLIVLGGGQASVWAKESYVNERAWIRKARAEHIPIFGICLGAQLLAYEFRDPSNDRPVHDNKWRRGWFDVHVKGVGSTDPVLLPVASVTKMIHWHYDAIRELPAGADKRLRPADHVCDYF